MTKQLKDAIHLQDTSEIINYSYTGFLYDLYKRGELFMTQPKLQIAEESMMLFDPAVPYQPSSTNGKQYDTFEITEIYLQRPQKLTQLKLSQWFCLAHGLSDWALQNAASLGDCKRQMIDKGYVFLRLEPLKEFNKSNLVNGK